jgi:plasmid stabilization system protein ParE
VRVVWTDAALDELERVHDYLFGLNPRAAARVADALRVAGDSLGKFPRRVRSVEGTSMRELVASFDYVIRCQIYGDVVEILRIRHTSRRPTTP